MVFFSAVHVLHSSNLQLLFIHVIYIYISIYTSDLHYHVEVAGFVQFCFDLPIETFVFLFSFIFIEYGCAAPWLYVLYMHGLLKVCDHHRNKPELIFFFFKRKRSVDQFPKDQKSETNKHNSDPPIAHVFSKTILLDIVRPMDIGKICKYHQSDLFHTFSLTFKDAEKVSGRGSFRFTFLESKFVFIFHVLFVYMYIFLCFFACIMSNANNKIYIYIVCWCVCIIVICFNNVVIAKI